MLEKPWTPPAISSLPAWPKNGRVSIDVETRDDYLTTLGPGVRRGAYITGYSFAIEGGPAYYIPLRHASGDNVPDPASALRYLRDQASDFRGQLAGAHMQYDLDFLAEAGIEFSPSRFLDIQIFDPLINELHGSYSLQSIALRRGTGGKQEEVLRSMAAAWGVNAKNELWKLPARHVYEYATEDAVQPLKILPLQSSDIAAQNLHQIADLESRLMPVLLRMRRRGVRFSFDRLSKIEDLAVIERQKACDEIKSRTGVSLSPDDVMAAEAVAKALTAAGLALKWKLTGKLSIDQPYLESLKHPVAAAVLRARKFDKLLTTYCASVRKHAIGDRIHTTFNQLRGGNDFGGDDEKGARFGRTSSSDPNLQNQPGRDEEFAKLWRAIYLPEEGMLWGSNDYSQQEPRVLCHYAELTGCTGAREFGDNYRNNPKFDTYDGMVKMTGTPRGPIKTIYLGLCYGMGGAKLCRKLGLPTAWQPTKEGPLREVAGPEGDALLKNFHKGLPFIQQLIYKLKDAVNAKGHIVTLLGRRCRFPEKPPHMRRDPRDVYDWMNTALNRLVQGSSGDQTKKALIDIDAAGHFLQLQIHDEVTCSVKNAEEGEQIAEIMRNAVKLRVPMRVDTEVGPSWGESMK